MEWMACIKENVTEYLFGQSFWPSEKESWVAECGKRSKVGGLSDDVNGHSAGCVLAMTWHRATDQYEQTFERRALNTHEAMHQCLVATGSKWPIKHDWIWWFFLAIFLPASYKRCCEKWSGRSVLLKTNGGKIEISQSCFQNRRRQKKSSRSALQSQCFKKELSTAQQFNRIKESDW